MPNDQNTQPLKKDRSARSTKGILPEKFSICGKEVAFSRNQAIALYQLYHRRGQVCTKDLLHKAIVRHAWHHEAGKGGTKRISAMIIALRKRMNSVNVETPRIGDELIETVKLKRKFKNESFQIAYRFRMPTAYNIRINKRVFLLTPKVPA